MVSVEYSEAIVEVLEILKHSEADIMKKIPQKLMDFFEKNKSSTYKPKLNHNKNINEMDLKHKTKDIIAMIYLNYLCDEKEKRNLNVILNENEKSFQQELRNKYNPDNIFKKEFYQKEPKEKSIKSEVAIIDYKVSVVKKVISKLKHFFHIK